MKGRWEPGEELISKDAEHSYRYARDVVEGRWEPGEEVISKDKDLIFNYAVDVIGGRLPEWMEKILLEEEHEPAAV